MNSRETFENAVRNWMEAFTHRSMHSTIQISKSYGLSIIQLTTLMRLHHCKMCRVSEISEHLGVSDAASSQLIHRLVEQDYVNRTEDPEDRRSKHITLSPKGQSLVNAFMKACHEQLFQLSASLTGQEKETIITALNALTRALNNLESGGDLQAAAIEPPQSQQET